VQQVQIADAGFYFAYKGDKNMRVGILFLFLMLLTPTTAISEILTLADTPKSFVRLGREASEVQVQQSIAVPNVSVTGVTIFLARRGTPTTPVTIAFRNTKEGPDLASATIQPIGLSDDPRRPTAITFLFNALRLTAGERFIVITAPRTFNSNSNHYYLAIGRYSGVGTLYYKGKATTLDLMGSIQFAAEEAPLPPPPTDEAPVPPPSDEAPLPTSPAEALPPTSSLPENEFEGFGLTNGGLGGQVFHVTSLADTGPGTLREALTQSNRYIVFDVAGGINLEHDLEVRFPFITIDGLSAPSPGITLRNFGIQIHGLPRYIGGANAHDVIVSGIRIRGANGDGIQIAWGAYNIVVDRVSVADSGDGNIDITHGAHDVTVQWSIMGGSQKHMLVKPTGGQDYPVPDTERISLHHNLFTGASQRNPRISNAFGNDSSVANEITADLRNNIIANWSSGIGTDVECGGKANVVNNFYSSQQRPVTAIIIRGGSDLAGCQDGGFAHVAGNVSGIDPGVDINTNPTYIRNAQLKPYPTAEVTTTAACDAARGVLAGAGMWPRDTKDMELISNVILGPCS
jgi:pectate lyase